MNILLATDSYKTSHHRMLPKGCTLMYGNWTPRSFKYAPNGINMCLSFGQQMVVRWLKEEFDKTFFQNPNAVQEMKEILSTHLGVDYDISHFQELHDLGYLPMVFKSLPEGVEVPARVPIMTWYNSHPKFAWLSLYLETVISNMLWKPMTTATIALQYRRNVNKAVIETDKDNIGASNFMVHDFSSRGMSSVMSSMLSGIGFITSSMGTDTLPAIYAAKKYYDEENVEAYSVFASEHSVSSACMGVMGEKEMVEYYMEQYPTGILSIVSDTLDLTKMVKPVQGGYLYDLKSEISKRDGKIVIRPDSNPSGLTPVDIVCGHDNELSKRELEADYPEFYRKGLIECLWDILGGTVNSQGYKVLAPCIGAIYGEAINLERQIEMYSRLKAKGFAATNIVLGIGSYTLNMNSRDTLGFAAKATYVEITEKVGDEMDVNFKDKDCYETVGREIFKDPITDDGGKKSAKGLLHVTRNDEGLHLDDGVEWNSNNHSQYETEENGELQIIFTDGEFFNETTLTEIRERVNLLL